MMSLIVCWACGRRKYIRSITLFFEDVEKQTLVFLSSSDLIVCARYFSKMAHEFYVSQYAMDTWVTDFADGVLRFSDFHCTIRTFKTDIHPHFGKHCNMPSKGCCLAMWVTDFSGPDLHC